jgi:C4-dicarboxylate transporter DctM subunit
VCCAGGCAARWRSSAALIDSLRVSSAIMLIVDRRVPVRLFPDHHAVHAKGGGLPGATCRSVRMACWRMVMVGYFILGAIMDELAMILLTVPIVFPAMMQLGFDPVWFGVIIVMAVTFGMICPPVGINVFVINSIARDITLGRHLPRHHALHCRWTWCGW